MTGKLTDSPTTNQTETTEDYGHVAALIREAIADQNEPRLRALLSNNVNMIVTALGLAAWASAKIKRQRIAAPHGDGS